MPADTPVRPAVLRARRQFVPAVVASCLFASSALGNDLRSATVPETLRVASLRAEARALEHGEGVARDSLRAFELYCEAALLGDAEAQFSLGWMYANGRGLARDDALAALFFGMAAAQGHAQAGAMLRLVGEPSDEMPECMREPARAHYDEGPPDLSAWIDEPFVAATPDERKVADLVYRLAPEYHVSPLLALAVIRAESNFDPRAVSPKNAQGLMQLIPETAARFAVGKPFDPAQNIRGGLAYLRWLLAYFQGDVALVAAAYNAGERAVDRYRGVPPFAETRAYVKRIQRLFRRDSHPFDARVTDPSPALERIRIVRLP